MYPSPDRRVNPILAGLAAAVTWLILGMPARGEPITYTFSGVGNGTVDSQPWSGDFTFTFTGDTSNITSGGGEVFQDNIGGTFTEGSYTANLLANNIIVVNNDPSFPRVGFFNSSVDNGGTIQNSSLTTYELATSFGSITGMGANLLPTFNPNGDGFGTTGGQTIELLGMSSLTFQASAVPEPAGLVLLATGLAAGFGFYRGRSRAAGRAS